MPSRFFPTVLLSATMCLRRWRPAVVAGLVPLTLSADEITGSALPARTASPSLTRFTALPAEATGVVVANDFSDPALWQEKYAQFAFGSLGTGVAIGDYDDDGRPDLFVVSKDGPSKLFRNLGDWKFEDVTTRAGIAIPPGSWSHGVTFTDVNNDRKLDLYLCRFGAPNLLFVNQGDGTFAEQAAAYGVAITDASVMGSFFDYDRDGWLDLYLQTNLLEPANAPQGQRDYLFHNRAGAGFANVTDAMRIFGATQGHSATWWDFNQDEWPDLYVANDYLTPDQLYRNVAGRGFLEQADAVLPSFPHFAMGADLGDVNDDGQLDLFVADMMPTDRDQNMRGMLNLQATMARDLPPHAAAQYMRNMLYVSTGTERFAEAAFLTGLAATGWTWSARFEDLDEDGRVDLHTTNGMVRDFLDNDLITKMGNQPFEQRRRLVLSAPELREKNHAFRNLGGLRFENTGEAWGLAEEGISFGAAFGDLDGDGDLDLVVANYQRNPTVYRNNSAENHRVVIELEGARSNRLGVGTRVEIEAGGRKQVRQLSLARGYASSSEPVLHFGLGESNAIDRLTITWPSGSTQILRKLPADRRYRLREPAVAGLPAAVAKNAPQFVEAGARLGLPATVPTEGDAGEFVAQPLLPFRKQSFGPGIAVADLNNDGRDDLLIGGLAGSRGLILRQEGAAFSAFDAGALFAANATADAAPLIADFNRDGFADVLLAKGGVNAAPESAPFQARLFFGTAAGGFAPASPAAFPNFATSAGPVVAADWNRDGWVDLFIGGNVTPGQYPVSPRSALLSNREGAFRDDTASVAPGLSTVGLVNAALWSDVDGDGWLDLLVACEWAPVRCWRNEQGQRLVEVTDAWGFGAAGSGFWRSLASADFNGDGKMDYLVGNLGTNTRYQASSASPLVLFRTPLTPQGRAHLIEAESIRGRLVPIRGRNQLARVMPELPRRFPTFAHYAAADVATILGAPRLAAAEKFMITELRTGVFLSSANGFRFQPLPQEAQLAPVSGVVAGDFDADGRADAYVVQNWYAANPEVGRFGGGVSSLLRGDGRGGFSAIAAGASGLLVTGEAKGLATLDANLDGWPDFVVTRRDRPHQLFLNEGAATGRRSLALRLVCRSDTPSPAGARVHIVSATGRAQTSELALGGGYLSQSAPETYFGWLPDDLPLRIKVTWPDGQRTVSTWQGNEARLSLPAPPLRP